MIMMVQINTFGFIVCIFHGFLNFKYYNFISYPDEVYGDFEDLETGVVHKGKKTENTGSDGIA